MFQTLQDPEDLRTFAQVVFTGFFQFQLLHPSILKNSIILIENYQFKLNRLYDTRGRCTSDCRKDRAS